MQEENPIDVFEALLFQLNAALDVCHDPAARRILDESADMADEAVTALNRTDFQARSTQFAALTNKVNVQLAALNTLKDDIDHVIHDVHLATDIAGAIDSAITTAAKFFPAI